MTIPSLSSTVLAALPSRQQLTEPKHLALGGIAATSIAAGGIIGKIKGHPLIGVGIGAAVAAVAVGAALLGNASQSYYDYPDSGGGRSYPSGGSGGRRTSPGDDGGWGGGHTSPGDSGGSHSSGNSTDNGNPSESDF
jgi:hypothetical protein